MKSVSARTPCRTWRDYVFHIEDDYVIVVRIIPAKMNKG